MKLKYTNKEKERLLDLIVAIAMEIHKSGIQIATKLDIPTDLIWDLRQRSLRAAMESPCECKDCNPSIKKST